MQWFKITFATVDASLFGTGTIIKYFEKSQMIVIAYFDWWTVDGKGPIVSIIIDWKGRFGVGVICLHEMALFGIQFEVFLSADVEYFL